MNQLQIFDHPKFGEVEILSIDGNPYFGATKSASALGYTNPHKAIRDHCREEGVTIRSVLTNGGNQEMKFISEGNLYRLISRSKLPGAEQYESWIFDEVLPTIRKHGAYLTPGKVEEVLLNPDTIIQLATQLKQEREAKKLLEVQVEKDRPKVLFADAVTTSKTSILVGELAKLLKQNGVEMGQNRLFQWLRENEYLIRRQRTDYNMPSQKSMELGLFEIKETSVTHSDGHITVSKTPKVTGKGQLYFINKFKGTEEKPSA